MIDVGGLDRLNSVAEEEKQEDDKPSPADLPEFLPWACIQLQSDCLIFVSKSTQQEYVSTIADKGKSKGKIKGKGMPSRAEFGSAADKDESISSLQAIGSQDKIVRIRAVYENDFLVELRFERNTDIPRMILKIVGLVLRFQLHLTTLTIKGGLDGDAIYEISKFLPFSYITDICFDGSAAAEANFYLLLEHQTNLRNLSLSRCNLNDEAVKLLALNLYYPKTASKTLALLNLSSNHITDTGAKYLADALRTNFALHYLNLSDNRLTDEGADHLFKVLVEFPLTYDEILEKKERHINYLKLKYKILASVIKQVISEENERKSKRKTIAKPPASPVNKKQKTGDSSSDVVTSGRTVDPAILEKAEAIVICNIGEFLDPFSNDKTVFRDGYCFSLGNNKLAYLNLSYNNLGYYTLKRLLTVLEFQKSLERRPRGLISVIIEGNEMPVTCRELQKIDDILDSIISPATKRLSLKKKTPSKK